MFVEIDMFIFNMIYTQCCLVAIKEADMGFRRLNINRKMSVSKIYRNNCQKLVLMSFIHHKPKSKTSSNCIGKYMYIEAKFKTITSRPIEIVLQDKLYLQRDTKPCCLWVVHFSCFLSFFFFLQNTDFKTKLVL